MKKLFVGLVVLFSVSASFAAPATPEYPQRCYFSGTYDEGYLSKTVWDMWVADHFGGDLNKFIIYSFAKVTDVPAALMEPGSILDQMLKLKLIAVARFLPSNQAAHEVMVLRKDSFQFTKENSDLTPFVILFNAFGVDHPILKQLADANPNNILQSKIAGPIEAADSVCND